MSTSIFLIADHQLFQTMASDFINAIPDLVTCGVADYGQEPLTQLAKVDADLVIIDLSLSDTDASEILTELNTHYPTLPVLVHSAYQDGTYAQRAMAAGATGYVVKRYPSEFECALWQVLDGKIYLSPL